MALKDTGNLVSNIFFCNILKLKYYYKLYVIIYYQHFPCSSYNIYIHIHTILNIIGINYI